MARGRPLAGGADRLDVGGDRPRRRCVERHVARERTVPRRSAAAPARDRRLPRALPRRCTAFPVTPVTDPFAVAAAAKGFMPDDEAAALREAAAQAPVGVWLE